MMKSVQYLITALTGLALIWAVSCQQSGYRKQPGALTVTDFRGKVINFAEPPVKIICLIESALSGFYMLHAGNRIIGISSNVYEEPVYSYYAGLDDRIRNKTLPAPGNWDFISIENLVALRPDLVVIWASQTEAIQSLEGRGIPVYAVMLHSLNDIYKEIRDLGVLTGAMTRADSLINYTQHELDALYLKVKQAGLPRRSVYFMWPKGPLETSGTQSTVNELIELAGARNACMMPQEHIVVNIEKLIEWNPEVIVMWYDPVRNPEDILKIVGWERIEAIRKNHVFEIPSVFEGDLWTLKFVNTVKLLNHWCYPELTSAGEVETSKQKMLKSLYGDR